jgi:desulfoferrodoxin-like iron-binding protein
MEKRAFERIPSNLHVRLCFENDINSGKLINLSKNGMLINTKVFFPLKTQFEILLPLQEEILKIPVKVSRLSKNDDIYDGIGAELLESPIKYLEFVDSQSNISKNNERKIKTFVCAACNHIAFDTAPINCPFCLGSIDNFADNSSAVNILRNFKIITEFEKKHFPVITISREYGSDQNCKHIDVHVKVGEIQHRMDVDDHISCIALYVNHLHLNKNCIARINLNCHIINPETTLRLNDAAPGIITVISSCNAHGSWMSETKI